MNKTYYQILQKSINYLQKDELTIDDLINRYNKLSSNELWEIFEYYSCIKYNVIQWNHVSFDIKDWLYDNFGITRDYGIDGLSEDKKVALQSKYRNGTNITFREASTFFALSSILKCEKMILSTLNNTKVDKIIKNFNFDIDKIDKKEFIKDIATNVYNNFSKFNEQKEKEVKLRPYQEKALETFGECIEKKKKQINIQMTCAAGKSFIIRYFIEKFLDIKKKAKDILILVPTILLADHMNELLDEFQPMIYHSKTKVDRKIKNINVYICVYNSIFNLIRKVKHFDLVIVDEGHHLDNTVKDKETYRATIQNLNVNYRLNLSATFHDNVELNDKYTIEDGIRDGYINDYGIVIPWFKENKDLKDKLKNIENGKWNNEECIEIIFEGEDKDKGKIKKNEMYTKKREFLQPMIFDSLADLLTRRIDMMWVLAYCNTISESKKFVQLLNNKGISAVHMDGTMNLKERCKILRKFEKGTYRVLSSVAILGEGIDLNFVDTVMFVSPRYSFINITQCIGRCLRKKNRKSNVVFPHIVEDAALEKFLNCMIKNDSRFIRRKKKGIKRLSRSRIEFVETLNELWEPNHEVEYKLYDSIDILIQDERTKKILKLKKWVEINNKLPTRLDEKQLAIFKEHMREIYQDMIKNTNKLSYIKLTQDEINLIESIPGWKWIGVEQRINKIDRLKKWIEINKRIPKRSSKNKEEKSLAKFMSTLRSIYKAQLNNKKYNGNVQLTDTEIKIIETIPKWTWVIDDRIIKIKNLKQWIIENKKMPSERSSDKCEKSLGKFMSTLKSIYKEVDKKKYKELSDKEINLIQSIPGWKWNKEKRIDKIKNLKKWVDNNLRLPRRGSVDKLEKQLAEFCSTLKKTYKNNKKYTPFTNKEIKLIESISEWKW